MGCDVTQAYGNRAWLMSIPTLELIEPLDSHQTFSPSPTLAQSTTKKRSEVRGGNPPPQIEWYLDGKPMNQHVSRSEVARERVSISEASGMS